MLPKGFTFPFPHRTNIQRHRPRHHHRSRSIRNRKLRRHVIQPLRLVRATSIRIPLLSTGPVKCRRRQHRSHHVVRVRIESAVAAKRHHHVRFESPHPLDQPFRCNREVDKLQPRIVIVHQLMLCHTQHLARAPKLLPPHRPQSFTTRRSATVRRSLSIRQANHIRLNPALRRQRQRSTKGKTLIIGMRRHAHQLQAHSASSRPAFSRSASSNSSAEISSISASGSTPRTGAKLLRCSAQGPISANARLCAGVA